MRTLLLLASALLLGAPQRIDDHTIAGEHHYLTGGPRSELTDATLLRSQNPGIDDFLRLWFAYSRGSGSVMVKQVLGPEAAWKKLGETRRAFAARKQS